MRVVNLGWLRFKIEQAAVQLDVNGNHLDVQKSKGTFAIDVFLGVFLTIVTF